MKVVFCVSLTWYTQKLSVDSNINKMHEAIKVSQPSLFCPLKRTVARDLSCSCWQMFGMIANSQVFLDATIITFLNKTDLFADLCKR